MVDKRYKDSLRRMAGNPTDKEIRGFTLFAMPAMEYDKEDLICYIIHLDKKEREDRERRNMLLNEAFLRGEKADKNI